MNMRARLAALFFIGIALAWSAPSGAFAATYVTSDIVSDTEWTTDGSPYIVDFADGPEFQPLFTIQEGITLTIDAGVVVKFKEFNGMTVNGTLRAIGTANNKIIFTSFQDDTARGDTNGDGSATTPTDRQWMHIEFNAGSNGFFDYAIVRYGGAWLIPVPNTGIENFGGTLTINHTTLTRNGFDGFGQYGGSTTITNSLISNQVAGIRMFGGELNVSSSSIRDNSVGIENFSPSTINARNNWWGDASGPYDSVGNAAGTGNGVSGKVTYSPWLASDPFAPDPCAVPGACASNVLFLPGIEGSRLYEGTGCGKSAEEKLWDPVADSLIKILRGAGDDKVKDLFLDSTGESVCSDIYAKTDDIIDSVKGSNIYKSFIDEMNGLKAK